MEFVILSSRKRIISLLHTRQVGRRQPLTTCWCIGEIGGTPGHKGDPGGGGCFTAPLGCLRHEGERCEESSAGEVPTENEGVEVERGDSEGGIKREAEYGQG